MIPPGQARGGDGRMKESRIDLHISESSWHLALRRDKPGRKQSCPSFASAELAPAGSKSIACPESEASRFIRRVSNHPATGEQGMLEFSVNPPSCSAIARSIANRLEHHRRRSLREEFIAMLDEAGIQFEEPCVSIDPEHPFTPID
ncbi:hypothetical protein Poly21_53540 [Allorhodopirellula heiligendammensis]|uniref:Uncharacterized protein n=1 Tax=Allorhodopirellula heiligendammensis TaxID=2714739 RepID=A0A5C6BEV2_9BACT|nr:hypothetical protein Poly21_53540 [Allorhodopirellula heiligendammensis]